MRKIFLLIISIIFCLVSLPDIQAQEINQKIDAIMTELIRLEHLSGSILLAKDGEVLYSRAVGEANKDHHVKNTLQTKFNIGSAGKTFTGVSIMQLAERGKLRVKDPVVKYLEDFPFGDKITIHHLLTHTAGTFNYFAHPRFMAEMFRIRSVNDALPLIYDQELLFSTPGEKYAYSNSGIVILGAVIEAVSGLSYSEYLKENILDPLGMHDTGINYWDEIVENRAGGYIKSPTGVFRSNIFMVPPANADGGIETTVGDLFKFDQALYGDKLINEESKKKMFTPFKNNYAYCWRVEEKFGNQVVWHGGGAPGVSARFKRYLNDRYTLIVLSNYSRGASVISKTIEAILFGAEYPFPKPTMEEYLYQTMREKGIEQTMQNIDQLLQDNGYKIKSDRELNFFGYALIAENHLDMALAVLKLNVRLFPDLANTYDSLGEAYMLNNENQLAIKNYRKSLELNPANDNAVRMIKKIQGE